MQMLPSFSPSLCITVAYSPANQSQGISASLSTTALPALLTLPTAVTARSTHTYLSSKTRLLSSYLRHITTFTLFSAYLLSPRRFRHPYLLYTSLFAFVSGPGVDYAMAFREGKNEQRALLDRMKFTEAVRATISGVAFAMGVVGIWGDGA